MSGRQSAGAGSVWQMWNVVSVVLARRRGAAVRCRLHDRWRHRLRALRRRLCSPAARHAQIGPTGSYSYRQALPLTKKRDARRRKRMSKRAKTGGASKAVPLPLSDFDEARGRWRVGGAGGAGRGRQPEEPLRHRGQAALHAAGLAGKLRRRRLHAGAGLPRPAADDARHLPHHAPRPHLVAAPADRPRRAGGLQRAAQGHPGARRHGRVADPLQLGLPRLRHRRDAARGARHLRGDGELGRGHGGLSRRHSRGRHLDLAQRSLAVHAAGPGAGGGEAPRHPLGAHLRHVEPVGLPLPLRRQPHVLPPRPAGRAARAARPHRLRAPAPAALEPAVGGRPAHAAGGRHAGRGHGADAVVRHPVRQRLRGARLGRGRGAAALHLLLRHLHELLRGGGEVPRRPAHLGAADARALRRQGSRDPGASSSTARPRAWTSRASSRSTTSRA